ncbi:MAG TPA: quinolinate synthase NadA [Abditibacteriaceae bacterium]|nr:quinolinate synthase NadA [Abditibacteriaceae bacterium]
MATIQLQGELGRAFKVGGADAWAGPITMASGAALQVPLPQRYLEMNPEEMALAIARAKERLGSRLVILGHHYQREEVIRWADFRGDSFKLCKDAAARPDAEYIIFCGVHFMAESADILSAPHQKVILPDLHAGCSMADIDQVEEAWDALQEVCAGQKIIPITYMNSAANLKAFVGRNGGAVCTSSNARKIMAWALQPVEQGGAGGEKLLFFPDQHLGRNTAVLEMGFSLEDCAVWNPFQDMGGQDAATLRRAPILLWKGHCSVHGTFMPIHVDNIRKRYPGIKVVVHPECTYDVVTKADAYGSTEQIKKIIDAGEPGAAFAVGTEINLVSRLAQENPDKTVVCLNPNVCVCSTMYRVDGPHLLWVLENLLAGRLVNQIVVPEPVSGEAKLALQRMLDIA